MPFIHSVTGVTSRVRSNERGTTSLTAPGLFCCPEAAARVWMTSPACPSVRRGMGLPAAATAARVIVDDCLPKEKTMNLRSAFLALVLPFFAATGCDMAPGDKTALSDSAAKAVVEKEWENDGLRAPMRGRYQLNHSNWDWDKGTTNEKTYKDLVALDKIGLVVLEPRPKPNWTPWEYTVRPTGEGEKFTHPKNPRDLFLSAGSFSH